MKLAVVLGDFPALSETFVLNQILFLINAGHEVKIYADKPRKENRVHPDYYKYELDSKVKYYYIPKNRIERIIKAIALVFKDYKNIRKNIKVLNFFKYGKNSLNLLPLYLSSVINKEEEFDLILCHFGQNGLLASILKENELIKGKIVTIFHGNDISEYVKKNGLSVYKNLINNGDLYLPVSDHWKKELIKLGFDSTKCIVHHMGIDTESFTYTKKYLQENEVVKILSIGRLVEKKGFKYSILAMKEYLNLNKREFEYNIIGDGPLKKNLEKLIMDLGLEKNVKLLGWRDQEEVRSYLGESHIFIAPSVTSSSGDMEGIPMVLMESIGIGLPVIASNHSGIPELVISDTTGFLTEERDYRKIAYYTEKIINNYNELDSLKLKAINHLCNDFDLLKQNEKLNDTLENLF